MFKYYWNKLNINYSENIFYIGIFFIPSAFVVSVIFLLLASIFKLVEDKKFFFKDKLNNLFLISGLLMIISCIVHSLKVYSPQLNTWSPYLSWVGLANWVPFYIFSWGFEPYLSNLERRKKSTLMLLAGSIPVIFSCIGQAFFNFHGPFTTFNRLIIWYSRPLDGDFFGATGLFNNPNITGAWLNIIWPVSLAFYINQESKLKKYISYTLIILISLCIVLTNSRAAWAGLFISSLMFFGFKSLKWLLLIFISVFSLIIFSISFSRFNILPYELVNKFSDFQYLDRLDIWNRAIQIILQNPFFGNGGSSFSELYQGLTGLYKNHSHNIALELMINYGIPAALFTLIPILFLLLRSLQTALEIKSLKILLFDKSLIIGFFIIVLMHMADIQYFDGRISITFWILIAAIKNIVLTNDQKLVDLENDSKKI